MTAARGASDAPGLAAPRGRSSAHRHHVYVVHLSPAYQLNRPMVPCDRRVAHIGYRFFLRDVVDWVGKSGIGNIAGFQCQDRIAGAN